jgi:hypothetical protein
MLVAGVGLAGERGLVELKGLCGQQPAVAGHYVTGVEHDDVSADHVFGPDRDDSASPPDLDVDLHPIEKAGNRDGGAVLLPEAEQPTQDDDPQDDQRVHPVAEEQGQPGSSDQDQHYRLGELPQQLVQNSGAAARHQAVGAVERKPLRSLGVGQSGAVALQVADHLCAGERPVGG